MYMLNVLSIISQKVSIVFRGVLFFVNSQSILQLLHDHLRSCSVNSQIALAFFYGVVALSILRGSSVCLTTSSISKFLLSIVFLFITHIYF